MPITFKQAEILGHSLGVNLLHAKTSKKKRDKKLPNHFFRNRFCAGEGHSDFPTLKELEKMGYMEQGQRINDERETFWHVTTEGKKRFIECFESVVSEQQKTLVKIETQQTRWSTYWCQCTYKGMDVSVSGLTARSARKAILMELKLSRDMVVFEKTRPYVFDAVLIQDPTAVGYAKTRIDNL